MNRHPKAFLSVIRGPVFVALLPALFLGCAHAAAANRNESGTKKTLAIPTDRLGAAIGQQYESGGLSIRATADGARLECAMQRLEGHAGPDGVWLASTAAEFTSDQFRVKASALGHDCIEPLPATGTVSVVGEVVRLRRASVVEEYTVSAEGIRQDFVVSSSPSGTGQLVMKLGVLGARAEVMHYGAKLVLTDSGREIAYRQLKVTDASGTELNARLEVATAHELTITVEDTKAIYPIRIDPTFSDANWLALGFGPNDHVRALAVSGDDLYVGGGFTRATNSGGSVVSVNRIAKWNGTNWSALGGGVNGVVWALAASGSNLYAGGYFTYAANSGGGAITANRIAKWDGSNWSALGQGMNGSVQALAVSGSDLYAGGYFTRATNGGGSAITVNRIAKWDGTNWSALGQGMSGEVLALAVSGSDLYVGGHFTRATNSGGSAITVNWIAKWDGSTWSALGSGMDLPVISLTMSGNDLYAGGGIVFASGPVQDGKIAKWNGNAWTALGQNLNGNVNALVVSGGSLYAGGDFYMATNSGGTVVTVNGIVEWTGNSWSALGSGMDYSVYALAGAGSGLYAGGVFSTAGGKPSAYIAKWAPLAFRTESVAVSNGMFHALVTGPDSNSVVVDGTPDFTNWIAVATNTLPLGGAWSLSLPIGTNQNQLYRARLGP